MILKRYKEIILYLFFGVLTTLVNMITYLFFTRIVDLDFLIANFLAWLFSILFAYLTNKFFVFNSKKTDFIFFIKEFTSFVSCRLISGITEMLIMYIMINFLLINDFIVKILTNIIVVILNFLFSKAIIFKNKI
ncbi:GtrA family protein [Clostridioides sp. ES-S-0108-01]|nr:GtrA family protein [Clostridioides sp. ES-S-0108-01]UDN50428.1 GtrA family protein [Clostridioides sp. ES-S-0107-01]